jgi:hypothetical protein
MAAVDDQADRALTVGDQPARRAPRRILDDPAVKRKIDDALSRIWDGKTRPGMGSEELLRLEREQHRLDT